MKSIGIYHSVISKIGGVETFLYNFCYVMRKHYDITIIYCTGRELQLQRLRKIVKLELYDSKDRFDFDIVIRNSVWGEIPDKIYSKENRYIEMRHANYKYLLDSGRLYEEYKKWDRTNEVVGCGTFVSQMSDTVLHDHPYTIRNILLPKQKTNKVLRLITCSRLDRDKGMDRMLEFIKMMRKEGIKFEWNIYTSTEGITIDDEDVHIHRHRLDIWDYLASSDYTVLLSVTEGLPYTVQESIQYKVPCIVSDIPGCTELITNGINGYVVPMDITKFDITKIKKIPKLKEYKSNSEEKWKEYLGGKEND